MTAETWRQRLDTWSARDKFTRWINQAEGLVRTRQQTEIGALAKSKLGELDAALQNSRAYCRARDEQGDSGAVEFLVGSDSIRVSRLNETGSPHNQASVFVTHQNGEGTLETHFVHISSRQTDGTGQTEGAGKLHYRRNGSDIVYGLQALEGVDRVIAKIKSSK